MTKQDCAPSAESGRLMGKSLYKAIICFAIFLGLGCRVSDNNPDCIWSFDIDSHQVSRRDTSCSIFNGQFPRKHFINGNSIFFFDSCGTFKKSITMAENQLVRVSARGELVFIRDNALIYSDASACSVQILSGNGDILCKSYFNIMLFNSLIGIEEGQGYFTGPSSFHPCAFFDKNLHPLRNAPEYYALEYSVNQTRKEVLFLASDVGGPLYAVTEALLLCTDYEGNVLWRIPLGRVLTKSFHIQADGDRVVTCFEDDAANARLIIYSPRGETAHSVVLPYRPVAISNILDGHFIILGNDDNSLVVHEYSAKTHKSKAFPISHKTDVDALASFSVELHKGNRLLITSRRDDTWDYALYERFNKRLDTATITQKSEPMVFVNRDHILMVRTESGRICMAR